MQATITKSTGSWYAVRLENGEKLDCRIRGKFKLEDSDATNPVAVGDFVKVKKENEQTGIITEILPRKNFIIRESPKHRKATHIIAANMDLAMLIVTLSQPRTSLGFIDRFLVTASAYHIPSVLIFNKSDICSEKEKDKLKEIFENYEQINYPCYLVSAMKNEGLDVLKNLILNKTVLFSGHSGSGKSTLLNALHPELHQKTSAISNWTGKGMHATTFAEMFEMPFGGNIIDTPGIKEFGLVEVQPEEICHYFPEMIHLFNHCKFDNCLHINEPNCAVKKNLEEGKIAKSRYESYCSMIEELKEKHKTKYT